MIKCFDVVTMVTDEASEQFGCLLKENTESKSYLHDYCNAIDILAKRFGAVMFEANVDDETTDITVTMVCEEFEITDPNDLFYKLAEKSKCLKISASKEEAGYLCIAFVFNGIWERAC